MTWPAADTLRSWVTSSQRLLEIGPLDRPILQKTVYQVRYVDHASRAELQAKYQAEGHIGAVTDVDVIWDGSGSLSESLDDATPIDGVLASHVFEHIPDPVGWLANVGAVLRPGGIVGLIVPDKRFTFDHNRRLSEPADLVDAYLRRAVVPSFAQIYDFHTKAIPVDTEALWTCSADYTGIVRPGDLRREAYDDCIRLRDHGGYKDVHCHTFTPVSFVDIFEHLIELNLTDLAINGLIPTQPRSLEFVVRLSRLDPALTAGQRRRTQEEALEGARVDATAAQLTVAASAEAKSDTDPDPRPQTSTPAVEPYALSNRERWVIEKKRQIAAATRRRLAATGLRAASRS
jgi:hypothetical protein